MQVAERLPLPQLSVIYLPICIDNLLHTYTHTHTHTHTAAAVVYLSAYLYG
jgi:hypothetical protein